MKVTFDEESDAVYARLDQTQVIESEERRLGVILDYDAQSRVTGV